MSEYEKLRDRVAEVRGWQLSEDPTPMRGTGRYTINVDGKPRWTHLTAEQVRQKVQEKMREADSD